MFIELRNSHDLAIRERQEMSRKLLSERKKAKTDNKIKVKK